MSDEIQIPINSKRTLAPGEGDDPTKIQMGDNPKHKMFMSWGIKHNGQNYVVQYHHGSMGFGSAEHNYGMWEANDKFEAGAHVGLMALHHDGEISSIEIHPEKRRQGLATKLYTFGHDLHNDIDSIPAPQHSEARTESGDAWAKSVGGEVPHSAFHVEDHNFRANRWTSMRDVTIPALKAHINEFHAKMMENGMDDEGHELARHHVESAHDYLDSAAKVGPKHPDYSTYMEKAHDDIDELGHVNEEWYGDQGAHERLQEHIGKLY